MSLQSLAYMRDGCKLEKYFNHFNMKSFRFESELKVNGWYSTKTGIMTWEHIRKATGEFVSTGKRQPFRESENGVTSKTEISKLSVARRQEGTHDGVSAREEGEICSHEGVSLPGIGNCARREARSIL